MGIGVFASKSKSQVSEQLRKQKIEPYETEETVEPDGKTQTVEKPTVQAFQMVCADLVYWKKLCLATEASLRIQRYVSIALTVICLILGITAYTAYTTNHTSSGGSVSAQTAQSETAPARSASSTSDAAGASNSRTAKSASKVTYVLNTNSKKIHRPSCRFVDRISDDNREDYTGTYDDLIDMGYEPCKTCDPW